MRLLGLRTRIAGWEECGHHILLVYRPMTVTIRGGFQGQTYPQRFQDIIHTPVWRELLDRTFPALKENSLSNNNTIRLNHRFAADVETSVEVARNIITRTPRNFVRAFD